MTTLVFDFVHGEFLERVEMPTATGTPWEIRWCGCNPQGAQ